MNIPRPYRHDECSVIWNPAGEWPDIISTPWQAQCSAKLTEQPQTVTVPHLPKPEFTLECWARWPKNQPQTPRRQDMGSLMLEGGCRGDLYIDENIYLCFTLRGGDDTLTVKSGKPVADALFGGQWQHLAVTARVMTGYFDTPAEAEINKLRRFNHIYHSCHSFDSVHTVSDESLAARSPTLPARQALLERLLEEKMGLPRRNNKARPAAPSDRMLRLQDRFVNLYHAPCALFELSLFAAVNPATATLEPFGQHTLLDRGPQLLEVCLDCQGVTTS